MRRLTGVLAVIALMLGATGQANAVLMLTGSGGAVLYQGPADYVTTSGTFTGAESTIIGMALTLGPNPLNATYSNSDVDFISNGKGGFAWSERILNSSGQAWNGLTVQINGGVPNFGDFVVTPISPIRVAISNLPPVPLTNPVITQTSLAGHPDVTVSLDELTATFTFATPVAAGSTVEIYMPIENLPLDSSFDLTETPIPAAVAGVPEPGTVLLLGAGLAGLGVVGRKRWLTGPNGV